MHIVYLAEYQLNLTFNILIHNFISKAGTKVLKKLHIRPFSAN